MENIISERRKQLELEDYFKAKRIAFYLVSLFYKSGRKYYCSRSKINRLLTIYKFCSIKYDPNCFHFSFINDLSYLIIKDISLYILPDCYLPIGCYNDLYAEVDDKQEYLEEFKEFTITNEYSKYVYDNMINNEATEIEKELIEIIFRKFGSYPTTDLAHMINQMKDVPFTKKIDEVNFTYVDLNFGEFLNFLNSKENNKLYEDNEIFKFIKEFNNIIATKKEFNKNDFLKSNKKEIVINKEEDNNKPNILKKIIKKIYNK